MKRDRKLWISSVEKERMICKPFQITSESHPGQVVFSVVPECRIWNNGCNLEGGRFQLNIRRSVLIIKAILKQNQLLRRVLVRLPSVSNIFIWILTLSKKLDSSILLNSPILHQNYSEQLMIILSDILFLQIYGLIVPFQETRPLHEYQRFILDTYSNKVVLA